MRTRLGQGGQRGQGAKGQGAPARISNRPAATSPVPQFQCHSFSETCRSLAAGKSLQRAEEAANRRFGTQISRRYSIRNKFESGVTAIMAASTAHQAPTSSRREGKASAGRSQCACVWLAAPLLRRALRTSRSSPSIILSSNPVTANAPPTTAQMRTSRRSTPGRVSRSSTRMGLASLQGGGWGRCMASR